MEHFTKDEMRAILTAARADSERDWLMILVAYMHGLRASEVVGNRSTLRKTRGGKMREFWPIRGVDIRDGKIETARLKGSLKTDQKLEWSNDPLFNEKVALEALAKINPGILFPITRGQYWRIWQKYGEKAGLAKTLSHPHIAKHSLCTHAADANVPLHLIQKKAGHKNISSTGAYLHADDDKASAAVAAGIGW
jgi:integrase